MPTGDSLDPPLSSRRKNRRQFRLAVVFISVYQFGVLF
jgi:hypothetical protein